MKISAKKEDSPSLIIRRRAVLGTPQWRSLKVDTMDALDVMDVMDGVDEEPESDLRLSALGRTTTWTR